MSDVYKEIDSLVGELGKEDTDVLAYFGEIDRKGSDRVQSLIKQRTAKSKLILMLATRGGSADAAYVIARTLQNAYCRKDNKTDISSSNFTIFVPTYCKSAGTLLTIGADALVMAPEAELGPIDVQLRKHDEVGERTSGLNAHQAVRSLSTHVDETFKTLFVRLRFDQQLAFSTKMASEIACTITTGLFSPIYGQIDPLRLAETERMLEISVQYGKRLAQQNLKGDESLARLVSGYPSHSFVIDYTEAQGLFYKVSAPDKRLARLAELFKLIYSRMLENDGSFIFFLDRPAASDNQPADPKGDGDDSSVADPGTNGNT